MTTSPTTKLTEAGNVYVDDVLYLPGDVFAVVQSVAWVPDTADLMTLTVLGGRQYMYRFSDTVEVVQR